MTGIISRLVRASMLDVLGQDFILTARAKGASELRVLLNHALRNALIPTLTIIGFSFAYLITGAVLTETIFSWPGIGSYAVDAARALDYPAIIGVTIVGGAAFLLDQPRDRHRLRRRRSAHQAGMSAMPHRADRRPTAVPGMTARPAPSWLTRRCSLRHHRHPVLGRHGADRAMVGALRSAAMSSAGACSRRARSTGSAPTRSAATC